MFLVIFYNNLAIFLVAVLKFLTFLPFPPICKYLMNIYLPRTKKNWSNMIINAATRINDFQLAKTLLEISVSVCLHISTFKT